MAGRKKTIGWRELVSFPEWGIRGVEAKVDTGARTSSLHVENVELLTGDRVAFEVVLSRKDPGLRIQVEAPLVRRSKIKTSTGHLQYRHIVVARVRVGDFEREIEISLVSRKGLLCRMLIGRKALMDELIVDPGRRYVLSRDEAHELGVAAVRTRTDDGGEPRRRGSAATGRKAGR